MKKDSGFTGPITDWSAANLSAAIHARQVSCREVMQAYLSRIAQINPHFNAIVSLQPETDLLAQADVCDAELASGTTRGWMHGLPQAPKDLAAVRGLPLSMGSSLMPTTPHREDGLMASRMRAAGALMIGKTNTPEFGLGSHTFNEVFGATGNAFDASRSAGGSSGGAAVALAQRLLPVADGSDFMGSLRNPAGWNNVFGFRPSQGRVPMWPSTDVYLQQLGTEGPMARTVQDLGLLLSVQAGWDVRTPLALAGDGREFAQIDPLPLQGVRIGWLGDLQSYLPMESGILSVCGQALQRLQSAGAVVENAALGTPPEAVWQTWLVWRRALVASRLAPFLAQPANRARLKPEALWEYDQAQGLTATQFLQAGAQRTAFYQQMGSLLQRHRFLALPSAQVWPFAIGERWPAHIAGREMDTYHRWMEVVIYATLAGLPCVTVPAGFNEQGMPMGLQLIGQPGGDLELLQLARVYEALATDVLAVRPAQAD